MMLSRAITLSLICLLLVFGGYGCSDDNGTNSNEPMPENLIGTWDWASSTMNGEPVTLEEISFSDTAQAQSLTLNTNHTWSATEYYDNVPVFTQSGTCTVSGNTLTIIRTEMNGEPVEDAQPQSATFNVYGDLMTITETVELPGITNVLISIYNRAM